MIQNLLRHYYQFGRLGLEVSADHREILKVLDSQFGSATYTSPTRRDLQFEFVHVSDFSEYTALRPAGTARSIFGLEGLDASYFETEDLLVFQFEDKVLAHASLSEGHARIFILDSFANHFCPLVRPFVTLPLIECFKRRGLYSMHAACLAKNGRGVILAGAGQEEKDALSLALAQAGFESLSDELVILNRIGPILGAVAFANEAPVESENAGMAGQLRMPHSERGDLRSETFDDYPILSGCTPAVILFPCASDAERGVLRTMKQNEALLELLPNVLLTDSYSSQAHLDALGDVVCQCECFRLDMGRNLNSVAEMVGRLIY